MTIGRLRAAGLRATRPRTAVLGYLERAGGHRTIDEILAGLADAGEALPRATVYDVVASLTSVGLVTPADLGPGTTRYEAMIDWHHHFVCRRCGRIEDIPCVVGAKPCLHADVPGTLDEAQVILRGICDRCQTD